MLTKMNENNIELNTKSDPNFKTKTIRKYLSPLFVYRIVVTGICVVLCLYQIQKICKIYFGYEVTTQVYYENVLSVTVPAFTLCTQKANLLRDDIQSTLGTQLTIKNIEDYLNQRTIAEQLRDLYSSEEFFEICKIMKPKVMEKVSNEAYISCNDITPIRTSIDYHNICYTVFSQYENESTQRYSFDFDVSIKNYFLEIISFKIKVNVSYIHLFIHSRRDKILDSFDYNHIELLNHHGTKSCIKYHITEIHLLSKPYASDCVDYHKLGYHSVNDCVLNCKIQYLKSKHKGWPGNYLSYNSSGEKIVDILTHFGNDSSEDLKLGKECRKRCGLNTDCYKEYFNFFEVKIPDVNENGFVINIFSPDFPNLVYINSPKMATEEMLCFLASIVGVWFGFSFLALSEKILIGFTFISNYVINYNQIKNNNIIEINCLRTTVRPYIRESDRRPNLAQVRGYSGEYNANFENH